MKNPQWEGKRERRADGAASGRRKVAPHLKKEKSSQTKEKCPNSPIKWENICRQKKRRKPRRDRESSLEETCNQKPEAIKKRQCPEGREKVGLSTVVEAADQRPTGQEGKKEKIPKKTFMQNEANLFTEKEGLNCQWETATSKEKKRKSKKKFGLNWKNSIIRVRQKPSCSKGPTRKQIVLPKGKETRPVDLLGERHRGPRRRPTTAKGIGSDKKEKKKQFQKRKASNSPDWGMGPSKSFSKREGKGGKSDRKRGKKCE